MLPLLLAAAADAAGHSVEAAAAAGPIQRFGVQWHYVLWQMVSFGVLAGALYWGAIRPLLATMDVRSRRIADGLEYSSRMEKELAESRQRTEAALREASLEAQRIVTGARQAAQEMEARTTRDAQAKADQILERARQTIEQERVRMMTEVRGEITRLVVATAERVLATELNDADRARYNGAAVRELAGR